MRTLAPGLGSAVTATITRPLCYVRLGFAPQVLITSGPSGLWNGQIWRSEGVQVEGLSWEGTSGKRGRITLMNTGTTYSILALTQGVRGRSVQVWAAYDWLTLRPTAEVLEIFNGEMGAVEIAPDCSTVVIEITTRTRFNTFSPRVEIAREDGFNFLPAKDETIKIGDELFRLSNND